MRQTEYEFWGLKTDWKTREVDQKTKKKLDRDYFKDPKTTLERMPVLYNSFVDEGLQFDEFSRNMAPTAEFVQ